MFETSVALKQTENSCCSLFFFQSNHRSDPLAASVSNKQIINHILHHRSEATGASYSIATSQILIHPPSHPAWSADKCAHVTQIWWQKSPLQLRKNTLQCSCAVHADIENIFSRREEREEIYKHTPQPLLAEPFQIRQPQHPSPTLVTQWAKSPMRAPGNEVPGSRADNEEINKKRKR